MMKGGAIVLVVLGHIFQVTRGEMSVGFRIIYAFHMPLFIMLSGMATSFGIESMMHSRFPVAALWETAARRVPRLILPFFAWGLVSFFWYPDLFNMGALGFAKTLFVRPDYGLWFLVALFWCQLLLTVVLTLLAVTRRAWGRVTLWLQLFLVGMAAYKCLLLFAPDTPGIYFAKYFFVYFLVGAVLPLSSIKNFIGITRYLPYVIFLGLVPFWYRESVSPVSTAFSPLLNPATIETAYRYIVAFSGIYVFADLLHRLHALQWATVNRSMALLGRRTLDIYASHHYFISLAWVPGACALLLFLSLMLGAVIRCNALAKFIFLGERVQGWLLPQSWRPLTNNEGLPIPK